MQAKQFIAALSVYSVISVAKIIKNKKPAQLVARAGSLALAGMFYVPRKLNSNRHGAKCPRFAESCQFKELIPSPMQGEG